MPSILSHDQLKCSLDYICETEECDCRRECQIYFKIQKIAQNKLGCYNYNTKKNHTHKLNGRLKRKVLRQLYFDALRTGFICPLCNVEMDFGGEELNAASIDHIIARSNGGTNDPENLRLICLDCNRKKATYENPTTVDYIPV
jgi:5-methylcytosine-specific restriction endonuclease McrA